MDDVSGVTLQGLTALSAGVSLARCRIEQGQDRSCQLKAPDSEEPVKSKVNLIVTCIIGILTVSLTIFFLQSPEQNKACALSVSEPAYIVWLALVSVIIIGMQSYATFSGAHLVEKAMRQRPLGFLPDHFRFFACNLIRTVSAALIVMEMMMALPVIMEISC